MTDAELQARKSIAIARNAIDCAVAVTKALAEHPYPASLGMAAAVGCGFKVREMELRAMLLSEFQEEEE